MRDQGIWSIGIARWKGVQIRLHMFFLLFAALTIYLGHLDSLSGDNSASLWIGAGCVAILLVSVLIHEFSHLIVAHRLGGTIDEVVVGPLGGLGPPATSLDPQADLVASVAGPLANLAICFVMALGLAIHGGVDLIGLMHPFAPEAIAVGEPPFVAMKLAFWINWVLVLVNMIPAFPFDGGRVLKASLLSISPTMDTEAASVIVARVAVLTSLALLVAALLLSDLNPTSLVQTWFALILLAIFVFFSARHEIIQSRSPATDEQFLGYDFSEGYTSLNRSLPKTTTQVRHSALHSWWMRRKALREQRAREQAAIEDGRVDQILAQVHERGVESLSPEDRAILDRASTRYRERS